MPLDAANGSSGQEFSGDDPEINKLQVGKTDSAGHRQIIIAAPIV
jgi:hypothetical protein